MRKFRGIGVVALVLGLVLSACVQVTPMPQQPSGGQPAAEQQPACEPAVESPPLLRPGKLIMSTNATIPPYQFIDDQGNLQGMRIELGEDIAQRLCLEPEWVNIQFEAQIPGLQGDRWDMINTGLFFTPERAEIMELVPYELQAVSVSVPSGNPDNVQLTEDLAGLAVGVEVAGYEETQIRRINDEQVSAGLEPMDIRTFNTFADAYQALRAGQVQAVVSVDVTAKFYEDQGEFDRVISGLAGTPASLAFKSTDLAETVAGVLNDMKADGTYDQLFEKWGATEIDDWENWTGEFKVY
jgi:polar amino acid transport system substrate-binding protein